MDVLFLLEKYEKRSKLCLKWEQIIPFAAVLTDRFIVSKIEKK